MQRSEQQGGASGPPRAAKFPGLRALVYTVPGLLPGAPTSWSCGLVSSAPPWLIILGLHPWLPKAGLRVSQPREAEPQSGVGPLPTRATAPTPPRLTRHPNPQGTDAATWKQLCSDAQSGAGLGAYLKPCLPTSFRPNFALPGWLSHSLLDPRAG